MTRSRSAIFQEAAATWGRMKEDYDRDLHAAYLLAERETNGVLVNAAGKAKGYWGEDLFKGPETWARKYASEELLDHWNTHPRLSLARYEASWIEGRGPQWIS